MTITPQWNKRPPDQLFNTLSDLRDSVASTRASSFERALKQDLMAVRSDENNDLILHDKRYVQLGARLSHYAFTQLCAMCQAPSGFLRKMPANLAATTLNWALQQLPEMGDHKALLAKESADTLPRLRALTTSSYGRIWNLDVVDATITLCEDGGPWSLASCGTSDRSMFIFLVNQEQQVKLPGDTSWWYAGVYIQNGETGKDVFEIATYLYSPEADVRLMLPENKALRIRHNRRAPMRFMQEALPALQETLSSEITAETSLIEHARKQVIKDTGPWLQRRGFNLQVIASVKEQLPENTPVTLWSLEQALLETAKRAGHIDERIDLERKASKLFSA